MPYFARKLLAQQLGYRNGRIGAGPYMYVTKHCKGYFPALSKTILNDRCMITINGVKCEFIYYNSKHATSNPKEKRDEYRIYLTDLGGKFVFAPQDIVILQKIGPSSYNMNVIKPTDPQYSSESRNIKRYSKRGDAALIT